MRIRSLLLFVPFLALASGDDLLKTLRTPAAKKAFGSITAKEARRLIHIFAAPDMEGRRAGSRGAKKAANKGK